MLDLFFTLFDWTGKLIEVFLVFSVWALMVLVIFDTVRKLIQDYRDEKFVKKTNRLFEEYKNEAR